MGLKSVALILVALATILENLDMVTGGRPPRSYSLSNQDQGSSSGAKTPEQQGKLGQELYAAAAAVMMTAPPEKLAAANAFIQFNKNEESYIQHNMKVKELKAIHALMLATANKDECLASPFGTKQGSANCIYAFAKYKTIPKKFRGPCAEAYLANCYPVNLSDGRTTTCQFLIKTSPGLEQPIDGNWFNIKTCADGIPMADVQERANKLAASYDPLELTLGRTGTQKRSKH